MSDGDAIGSRHPEQDDDLAAFAAMTETDDVEVDPMGAEAGEDEELDDDEGDGEAGDEDSENDQDDSEEDEEAMEGVSEEEIERRRLEREAAAQEREEEMERIRESLRARGYRERGVSEQPAPLLPSFDLRGVAEYISKNRCHNIIVMCGAGISVSAGIPDFRTPGTGCVKAEGSPKARSLQSPLATRIERLLRQSLTLPRHPHVPQLPPQALRQPAKVRPALAPVHLRAELLSQSARRLLPAVLGAMA